MKHFALGALFAVASLPGVAAAQNAVLSEAVGDDDALFARDTYRLETIVCPFKGSIEYEPGDIECSLLQVPENRERADSRLIELHVIKLNSTWDDDDPTPDGDDVEALDLAPGKRDDPIIYLTGGPGAEADYYVKRFKNHGIRKHRDLYILEQRGIASSGDFCPFYATRKPEVGNVPTFELHLEAGLTAIDDCASNAAAGGVDLSGYNTFEIARDVKALRRALGIESWNVWGISYGTMIGQAYIKVDPEAIRAVVLDANVPFDVRNSAWAWSVVQWYDRDLTKLEELCQAQPDCARRYPDLGRRIREATLSVRDNPIVVEVKDIEHHPTGKAYFFTDIVAFLPFTFLYEQSNYPALPGLIHAWADAVERRDEDVFKAIASIGGGFAEGSQGMANAVLCMDGDAVVQVIAGREEIEKFPVLGPAIGSVATYERRAELCLEHGMAPRDALDYAPVETDLPALIVEGDMDPITPPPLAHAILPGFSNATYVEFPYAGHGPSRSVECAGDMLNAFFDNPSAEPDLSCVDEMEAPDFWVPIFETTVGPRLMVKALEDKKSLVAPGIWAASSMLVPVIGFLVLSFAPVVRRIEGRRASPAGLARAAAWTAALLVVLAVTILGAAVGVTYKEFEELLLLGLVPWARFGAVAGLLAGAVGIVAAVLSVRARTHHGLPVGSLVGFLLTALAAVSFSVFLMVWGLGPF